MIKAHSALPLGVLLYFCGFIKHFIKHIFTGNATLCLLGADCGYLTFNLQKMLKIPLIMPPLPAATRRVREANVEMGNGKCEIRQFYIILNDRQLLFLSSLSRSLSVCVFSCR